MSSRDESPLGGRSIETWRESPTVALDTLLDILTMTIITAARSNTQVNRMKPPSVIEAPPGRKTDQQANSGKNLSSIKDAVLDLDIPNSRLLIVGDGEQRAAASEHVPAPIASAAQTTPKGAEN